MNNAEFVCSRLQTYPSPGETIYLGAVRNRRNAFQTRRTTEGRLYILKRGSASLVMKAEEGTEILHLAVGPDSILGAPAVVTKEPYTLSARACIGSAVDFVKFSEFEDLMRTDPSLFPLLLAVLAAEVRAARIALTRMMTKLASRPSRLSSAFSR